MPVSWRAQELVSFEQEQLLSDYSAIICGPETAHTSYNTSMFCCIGHVSWMPNSYQCRIEATPCRKSRLIDAQIIGAHSTQNTNDLTATSCMWVWGKFWATHCSSCAGLQLLVGHQKKRHHLWELTHSTVKLNLPLPFSYFCSTKLPNR